MQRTDVILLLPGGKELKTNEVVYLPELSAVCVSLLLMATLSMVPLASAQPGSPQSMATPVPLSFFINGQPDIGTFTVKSAAGSQFSLNVTATYPWATYAFATNSISIQYSVRAFPLAGVVPVWLGLSLAPSSLTLMRGSSSSTALVVAVAGAVSSGQRGSFSLNALYNDPVTKASVLHVMVINVTVDSTSGVALPSTIVHQEGSPNPDSLSASWALGAGLCDSSNTTPCGGTSISWGSQIGVSTTLTVPSFTDSTTTYITLNGAPASGWIFQFVLLAPASGSTWQESLWVGNPQGQWCSYNTNTVSSGTSWKMEILYVSSHGTTAWYAVDSQSS